MVIPLRTSAFHHQLYLYMKKKRWQLEICVDYRALNKITIKYLFPILTIDEILDELLESKLFTKLELQARYHHIRTHESDIHKIAFHTHEGYYEFVVMRFYLFNTPATFQIIMNALLKHFFKL